MKNYEIKNATANLSLNQKIVVSGKRLAYLVPHMYTKVLGGFKRLSKLPGKAVEGVGTIATKVEGAIANSESIQTALKDAQTVRDDLAAKQVANYEEQRTQKEESVAAVEVNEKISETEKKYIIKAYETDIQRLKEKSARVANAPRRLLISTVFIGKLISNSRKKRINDKVTQKLESIPPMQTSAPEVQQAAPVAPVTAPVEPVVSNTVGTVQTQEQAKEKYLDLHNQAMLIQQQMADLAQNFGLTREMFQENQRTR